MERNIKALVEGKSIQLVDWVVMEYSSSLVGYEEDEVAGGVAVGSEVTKHDDDLYLLDMTLDAQPPQESQHAFKYHCRVQAKFITMDTFEDTDFDARMHILTDGLCELYTLTKGFLAANTGNSESDPVILPSISVTTLTETQ